MTLFRKKGKVMASDVGTIQGIGHKQEKDKKSQNWPDYLRYVARKSRAGFDKVHDELTKLYTAEKSSQRQTVIHETRTSPERDKTESPATSPNLVDLTASISEGKQHKRMSLRKQWARSGKTKTLWMSSGRQLPTAGSFVSYIDEDMVGDESKLSQHKKDIEELKEDLNPRRNSAENMAVLKPQEINSKSYSANQVIKDKTIFKFDKLSASKSLDFDQGLQSTIRDSSESDSCPDYINIQGYSLHVPFDNQGGSDDTYDVPKFAVKPPVTPRKGNKELKTVEIDNKDTNSKRITVENDYMPMDDVDNIKNEMENREHKLISTCDKKDTQLGKLDDSGDYMQPDACRDQPNGTNSGYTGLGESDVDNLYTTIQKVKPKSPDVDSQTTLPSTHDMSESGDYVLPETCIDKPSENKSGYTGLEHDTDDNLYTPINRKGDIDSNVTEVEETIYANCTSALYDDFGNLRENEVHGRTDCESIYDVPASMSKHVNQTMDIMKTAKTTKTTKKKLFHDYSVTEVVDCLNACALPHLASICEQEHLDGHFFKNFDESEMVKEPFLLNWFHIAKLRRIILGWRPKQ